MTSIIQRKVEQILADPKRIKVLFLFYGNEAQVIHPSTTIPTDTHFLEETAQAKTYYDMSVEAGVVNAIDISLYVDRSVSRYDEFNIPEGEYEIYIEEPVDENLPIKGSLLVFKFPLIPRNNELIYRIVDIKFIEGMEYTIFKRYIVVPYRYKGASQ